MGDTTKVKLYNLKLVATSKYSTKPTYYTTFVNFQINVFDICPTTVISPTSFTSPVDYDIWSMSTKYLVNADWTQSHPECPSITYSIKDHTSGLTPDSIFTLAANKVSVTTSSPSKASVYQIDLIGKVTTYKSATVTVEVNVFDSCQYTSITTAPISSP